MPAPDVVRQLIQRFSDNQGAYKGAGYKEAQLRQEFINPLFEALGWDLQNRAGNSESFKDVVHEEAIKIGGMTKAPDYSFRIGGRAQFFVEVKKPAVNLKDDEDAAFQLRRYAWSAKLPVSILTDFEEFVVYDTRIQPKKGDKAAVARLRYDTFTEFDAKWVELAALFSKDAVLKGGLERYVQSKRPKKGTAEVDRAFLEQIEEWRAELAKNLKARNKKLDVRSLNFAVQRIIDRIVFLRICEDRGIESQHKLEPLLNGANVYGRLKEIFEHADDRYNSGLFHFKAEKDRHEPPDELTLGLKVDDDVLQGIIKGLYYPQSPYDFRAFPAEILGQVYEQFLGKVIRLTDGGHVKVEDKPEVKKAGGVYYTPSYIVDYIVKQTVGKLLEGKAPRDAAKITVLDPACGSGSFLIGAYQHLLDWHRDWYETDGPEKHKKELYQGPGEVWRLTTSERKRILLNSIYGVDIDQQAVEVTKLSLLLKVLEGESAETINQQFKFFHERALPDLGENIKCGNSLIGTDYYLERQMNLLGDDDSYQINAFDWLSEFGSILAASGKRAPGFDVVIGNPPYVFGRDWRALHFPDEMKEYLGRVYTLSPYQLDMFSIFMEKASLLCHDGGRVGQIVPNVWLSNTYSSTTRAGVLQNAQDLRIALPPKNVFKGLTVDTIVYSLRKSRTPGESFTVCAWQGGQVVDIAEHETKEYLSGAKPISTTVSSAQGVLLDRIRGECRPLSQLAMITRGVHAYRTGGYGQSAYGPGPQTTKDVDERPYHRSTKSRGFRPFVLGRDLRRFSPTIANEFIKYGPWLAEPRSADFFDGERIYSRKILGDRLIVTLESGDSVADQQVYVTKPKPDGTPAPALAGILGSRFLAFFIRAFYDQSNDAFPQIKVGQLQELPIPKLNSSKSAILDRIGKLVSDALLLHGETTAHVRPESTRRIVGIDKQIDELVYQLYGLTDAEIKIVEEATE